MKTFRVANWYTVYKSYEVEANTEEEAIEQAHQLMHEQFEKTDFTDIEYSEPFIEEINNEE